MALGRHTLLLADPRPTKRALARSVEKLHDAGERVLLVTTQPLPPDYADIPVDEAHALGPAAAGHGSRFRRALRQAEPPEAFWLHVRADGWVQEQRRAGASVQALNQGAQLAARRLTDAPVPSPRVSRLRRPPAVVVRLLLAAPGLSERRRYQLASATALRLLGAGRDAAADQIVRSALERIDAPRLRADLLGDLVSAALAGGRAPELARDACAAELEVADRHYMKGRHRAAAWSFIEATRIAFHRVLHFDRLTFHLSRHYTILLRFLLQIN